MKAFDCRLARLATIKSLGDGLRTPPPLPPPVNGVPLAPRSRAGQTHSLTLTRTWLVNATPTHRHVARICRRGGGAKV